MKKVFSLLLLITFVLMVSSCATVLKGSKQAITIDSNPSGAQVYVDGNMMGQTPLTVDLKKNKHSSVKVTKEGYVPQQQPLGKEYDMTAILNVFWDWSTTDLITGNAYQYSPTAFFFQLEEED